MLLLLLLIRNVYELIQFFGIVFSCVLRYFIIDSKWRPMSIRKHTHTDAIHRRQTVGTVMISTNNKRKEKKKGKTETETDRERDR